MDFIKYSTVLIFGLLVCGCKEVPTYNPFDQQINVSVQKLAEDGCDTLGGMCGYFNLMLSKHKLKPYYQVFAEDFDEVIAKGFVYDIDTFQMQAKDNYEDLKDSILSSSYDEKLFNSELLRFDYSLVSSHQNSVIIKNNKTNKKVRLSHDIYLDNKGAFYTRSITYFTSKNELLNQ